MVIKRFTKGLAGIQYAGSDGVTQDCIDAVIRLIQCDVKIEGVRILSNNGSHGFFIAIDGGEPIAVKSGFTSGYPGEGPRGLSYVISLLDAHVIDLDEVDISPGVMDRLNASALTANDLAAIDRAQPVHPARRYDYIHEGHLAQAHSGKLWQDFDPIIPYAIIDPRIIDLAKTFWGGPDDRLLTGFRRLEDIVRKRSGLQEHGSKLFSQAFAKDVGKLGWPTLDGSEQIGRMSLFTAVYMAYRNPRAHQEQSNFDRHALSELLLLNHLYSLEAESVVR